jgi:hypothetical protein
MRSSINIKSTQVINALILVVRYVWDWLNPLITAEVYFGRNPAGVPPGSVIFFPIQPHVINCGIAAIVSYKNARQTTASPSVAALDELVASIEVQGCESCRKNDYAGLNES